MHKYRHAARFSSWYDKEGEPASYNPFKKIQPRVKRSTSSQLEDGLLRSQTAPNIRTPEEQQRRREWSSSIPGPDYSGTFPPDSPSTQTTRPADERGESSKETSDLSGSTALEPTTVTKSKEEPVLVGPRQRKKFNFFGKPEPEKSKTVESIDSQMPTENKQQFTFVGQLKATIFNSWINILLVAAPVGIIINYLHIDPRAVFVVNFIAIVPLAAMLSYATEEIALRTGETIGGLLNASFGNAVELIVAILALVDNQVVIVQTSLIGSMLSNLLLVMGMCFFFGGFNRMEQRFNQVVAQTASSLLVLASGSLIIPTAFHTWSGAGANGIAPLSRGTSVILLVVYGAYLFFQLKSHAALYNEPSPKTAKRRMGRSRGSNAEQQSPTEQTEPEDEKEEPQLSIMVALLTLAISTALVALCADYMVESINEITQSGGISKTFVGLILLPIVGNAAEHATAVTVAMKDKMDLAIGVAVGSSMQIALLVLPLVVVIGWIMGNADMTLYFDGFQITILFVAVLLVNYLITDGKSHWLEGVMLMTLYLIIAVAAWFYPAHPKNVA